MARFVSRFLPVRPGEWARLSWLALIGMAYAAATALGDDIAQAVFVTRVGAEDLPRMFIFKGLLDVAAAGLYLPLTRGRSVPGVWRVAIGIYVVSILVARIAVASEGVLTAYVLYIAHECAWTILTIHWGVFILDAFDASQSRRLFPVLFTAARVGGIIAGSVLQALVIPVGTVNMLFVCAAFACVAGALSLLGRRFGAGESLVGMPVVAAAPEDPTSSGPPPGPAPDGRDGEPSTLWAGWRRAASSPLVRAIALSTAAMVLCRYGLRMVSIDHISAAFHHDEAQVASFLGWFTTWANLAGMLLGVFVVPGLLHRFGVGAANLAYAWVVLGTCGSLLWAPGLAVAALARFVDGQFKSALKTPLSTLFYGAEPPRRRSLARAFVFGAVIPGATLSTSLLFELGKGDNLRGVAWIALVVAIFFVIACWLQNRRWRLRLRKLLRWHLERDEAPEPENLARARAALSEYRSRTSGDTATRATLEDIATGLASGDSRVRALGEEVLAETIPRMRAHRLARPFVGPRAGPE